MKLQIRRGQIGQNEGHVSAEYRDRPETRPGQRHHDTSENEDGRRVTQEKVIKNLEVIPTMVQNLLEARVRKARDKVRTRVHGIIQNLSVIQEENWEDHEQLVSEMRLISQEVEKIAGDAVRSAAEECHAHAVR